MAKWIEACCVLGLLFAASSCRIVDTKYYDRLLRNGAGGGQDDDGGADSDAEIDAAVSGN